LPGASSKWRGEASAIYLYLHQEVTNNIQFFIPNYQDLRIIMILRNPVERAFSQYMRNVRNIKEPLSFEEAIEKEAERKLEGCNSDFFYIERGFYYEQVKTYLEKFDYVKVILYDDFTKDLLPVIDSVLEFLHLKRDFEIDTTINYDKSGHPKFGSLIKFRSSLINENNPVKSIAKVFVPKQIRKKIADRFTSLIYDIALKKKSISKDTYLKLLEVYKSDIEKLGKLIERDLSGWLKPKY
jgi:hypothetical protein